jgi:cellulose synthase/poly-beta-1,6-N-acetylglucosamine synthase-like glycosyltransferase
MSLPPIIFWCSLAALAYLYAGYPALAWLLGRIRRRDLRRAPWTSGLSIVVVAHNEAHRLRAKLDNLLACDGAERIVEILVGSDGSDDDTAAVIAAYPDQRVRLLHFPERRGKPAVLNALVPQCRSELVVLTDVRQMLAPDALSRLAENFADERVGVASGELVFRESNHDTAAAVGMGAYWTYEKLIRKSESRFRGVPGATGALYAMRRSLFRPVPENTLLDDVVIPMQAVEQGALCLLETGAIAWDVPSQSTRQESVRKRRTIAGCAQLAVNQPRWLLPWRNPIWWEFVSHKLARLASPLLLASLLAASVALSAAPLYASAMLLQVAFYLAAFCAWLLQRRSLRAPLLGPVLMFVSLNLTTLAALWDACRGRYRAAWQRSA